MQGRLQSCLHPGDLDKDGEAFVAVGMAKPGPGAPTRGPGTVPLEFNQDKTELDTKTTAEFPIPTSPTRCPAMS